MVSKLFGVKGRMSHQRTCCGPDRYKFYTKKNKLITILSTEKFVDWPISS